MHGRFIVTKELLELNLQASQNLEMSENLDETEEYQLELRSALSKVNQYGGHSETNRYYSLIFSNIFNMYK